MKHFFLTVFLLTLCFHSKAKGRDELKKELSKAETPTETAHILSNLAFVYSKVKPDSGLVYGNRALEMSLGLNNHFEMARANASIGINYMVKSQYSKSLKYQLKALNGFTALDSLNQVADMYTNICLVCMKQADYKSAMEYAIKALSTYEKLGETNKQGFVLGSIGTLFFRQDNFDKAVIYYESAYKIFMEGGDTISMARNRGNLGMVLTKMGRYAEAEKEYKKALRVHRSRGESNSIRIAMSNLGLLEYRRGYYEKALLYFDSAQVLSQAIGTEFGYLTNLGNIGEVYVKMAQLDNGQIDNKLLEKGTENLQKAIDGCLALSNGDPAIEYYEILSEAYGLKGNYRQAFDVFKKGQKLKDSIHSSSNRGSLENMEVTYQMSIINQDLQLKNQELVIKDLELNESKQRIMLFIMGLVILLFIGGITIYLLRKSKLRNRSLSKSNEIFASKIEEQLDSLAKHATVLDEITYMQAHHVREPVSTILGMVEHFNLKDPHDPVNLFILENLSLVSKKLDVAVREIINKKEEV